MKVDHFFFNEQKILLTSLIPALEYSLYGSLLLVCVYTLTHICGRLEALTRFLK